MGGVEAVINVMNEHIGSIDVCKQSCDVLGYLSLNSCKFIISLSLFILLYTDKSRTEIRTFGGIEAITKVISIHVNNTDVCCAGCGALWSITVDGKSMNKQPITPSN